MDPFDETELSERVRPNSIMDAVCAALAKKDVTEAEMEEER